MTEKTLPTVALIDVAGIFRSSWAVAPDHSALTKTVERVRGLRSQYDHCAICVDSPPYRRSKIDPGYKAQRERAGSAMLDLYAATKQRLADDGLPVFAADGYEADDVIATLVAQLVALPADKRVAVTVVSADKDLMQLVDDKRAVTVFNWSTGARFDEEAVIGEFKVSPSGIRDLLALAGDSSDNIAGVKGVGRITAAQVVNSGPGLEGALVGEYIKGITPSCAERIAEAKEAVRLAQRLVTLETDAPVSAVEIFAKREPKPSAPSEPPRAKPVAPPSVVTTHIVPRPEEPRSVAAVDNDWGMGVPVEMVVKRVEKIREIQRLVMKLDQHYGVVPGTGGKPSLLKPGAELLTLVFQLDPQFALSERREGDHLECIMTCTIYHAPTGTRLGSGVGSCTTRESKYAWRKGERRCPRCKAPAITKSKFDDCGWFCFDKKGGCGAKFELRDQAITSQSVERVANPDLPDSHNTIRKMAAKRAHVAAILLVTCASEIFTQDAEDNADPYDDWAPPQHNTQQRHRGAA